MAVHKVVPGVYQLQTIAYSYYAADDHLIVDTAFSRKPRRILDGLGTVGYAPKDISKIVITHAHPDHVGGLAALREATGAKVCALEAERPFVEGLRSLPKSRAVRYLTRRLSKDRLLSRGPVSIRSYLRHPGSTPDPFQIAVQGLLGPLRRLKKLRPRPAKVDQVLHDGDLIGDLRVVATPGHTPGHLSLWDERRSLVIGGDAVRVIGPYVGPDSRGLNTDHAQAIESFLKLGRLDFENLVSGHGEVVIGGAGARLRASPFFSRTDRGTTCASGSNLNPEPERQSSPRIVTDDGT